MCIKNSLYSRRIRFDRWQYVFVDPTFQIVLLLVLYRLEKVKVGIVTLYWGKEILMLLMITRRID